MEKIDAKEILEQLVGQGKALADKGMGLAEEKFDLPAEGPERDAMLKKLSKGAAVAGVLAIMLGTRGGRAITGGALKLGSVAAIGGLAYNAFHTWKLNNPDFSGIDETPIEQLAGPEAGTRGALLLRSMIAAANADGHIDAEDQRKINDLVGKLGLDDNVIATINAEQGDVESIAKDVQSMQVAAEVYLASLVVLDQERTEDRDYLDHLSTLLELPADLAASIEEQSGSVNV